MADSTLLLLLDEVRGKTIRVVEGVTHEEARWAPEGLQNTILWHCGHCYVVVESLTMRPLGRPPEIPDGWFEMFSWESRPERVPTDRWPDLSEVLTQLDLQHQRFRELIAGLSEAELAGPSVENAERTVRYSILHGLHDEARHSGEITLLRKIQATMRPIL